MQIENNGENIEVSKKYAKKITRDEMDAGDNKADRKAIFESMDTNKDGELSTTELADAFSRLDADGDGKVTDAEINAAVDAIPNIKQAKKAEYIAYLKDMAAKNNEKAESEAGNTYTVQLGEQYDDLIARILKSRGIDNPTEEQIKAAKKQFEADNEGAFTRNEDGSVKWLLAGKQVFVRTGTADDAQDYMKDKNNASEVLEDYNNWVQGGKKLFTYDAAKPNAFRESGAAQQKATPEEKAKEMNLRTTYASNKGWYYSDTEKMHYRWNEAAGTFIKMPGVLHVYEDGTFDYGFIKMRDTAGSDKGWYYSDKEKTHYKWDDKKSQFVKRADVCQVLGTGTAIRTTDATDKGWYYSNEEREHYKWDSKNKKYVKMPGIKQVDKNGTLTYNNIVLRETDASALGWYYSEAEKTHYKWDDKENKFVKRSDVRTVASDGTYQNA